MNICGTFTPGETAIFEANRPVVLGIARDGDIVVVREYRDCYSVGGIEAGHDGTGYDAPGYAVECAAWGRSAVHPEGWWFCDPSWLKAIVRN